MNTTRAMTALALGGFGIGTTEFATMGLLPQIAETFGIPDYEAGHAISLYAAGVVVGAPLIAVLGAKLPRKGLLISLMLAVALGNHAVCLVHSGQAREAVAKPCATLRIRAPAPGEMAAQGATMVWGPDA